MLVRLWGKENSYIAGEKVKKKKKKVSCITNLLRKLAVSAEVYFSADPISKQFYH